MSLNNRKKQITDPNFDRLVKDVRRAANRGDENAVAHAWEEYIKVASAPSVRAYNVLINAFAKAGRPHAVQYWFDKLQNDKMAAPNVQSYNGVIEVLAKRNDFVGVDAWLEKMYSSKLSPNIFTFNLLIGSSRDSQQSALWLDRMKEAKINPDMFSFSSIVANCARNGDARGAQQWLDHMESTGHRANVVSTIFI